MTKGFLLVDYRMNTVIVPYDNAELGKLIKGTLSKGSKLKKIHKHNTFKELGIDVKAYLNGEYKEE